MHPSFVIIAAILLIATVRVGYYYEKAPFLQATNDRPIIGIMTQPSPFNGYPSNEYSFIAASYVKFLEQSGARYTNLSEQFQRVVPIPYEADNKTLENLFQSINGFFLPGGSSTILGPSKLTQSASYILHRAIEINDKGDFFPIMAECLGHEMIHYILSGYYNNTLSQVYGEEDALHALQKTKKDALLYRNMDDELFKLLTTENLCFSNYFQLLQAYYHHVKAIVPNLYQEVPFLGEFFEITSVNYDSNGTEFIASAQAKKYPIITTQYHGEKNSFEWRVPANHSSHAVRIAQAQSNAFVDLARKNHHQFQTVQLENSKLIYNYPCYSLNESTSIYSEVYIIKKLNGTIDDNI